MRYLKQSTTVTVKMGPFLDATDGVTEETGLTPAIEVSKAEADFVARNSATAVSHDADGWYNVELDTTDTATAGSMIAKSQDNANHLPVWHEFMVLPANVYDSMFGSDKLQVDLTQIDGLATNGNNATLNLKQLNIQNSAGDAIYAAATGGNGNGASLVGDGSGEGLVATGGATGDGIRAQGGSSSGHGLFAAASPADGHGIYATSGQNAANAGVKMENALFGAGLVVAKGVLSSGFDVEGTIKDLRTIGLDHLLAASVAGTDVVDNSVVAKLVSSSGTADWDTYDNTTDSQQAIRDNIQTPLDAAGVRSAIGLASANLDTQLAALPTAAENADAVWDEARGDHVAAGSFGQSFAAVVNGQAATGTLSTTQATTNLTEATDNHYNDRVVVWVSGVLTGQACQITDYNGTTKTLTYTPLTEAPSNGDRFVIV